jgi:hypothetical protein
MTEGRKEPARIRAYLGGSGTGKTLSVLDFIRRTKPRRLLVWDPNDEHAELAELVPTARDLVLLTQARTWRLRLVPTGDQKAIDAAFAVWCRAAFKAKGATVYVEELGGVTRPTRSPPAWRDLCTKGRHQGLTVIGSAQRPGMIDKDFLGNATYLRTTGGFRYAADADVVAKTLRVPLEQVDTLPRLHWIERDFVTGILKTGELRP